MNLNFLYMSNKAFSIVQFITILGLISFQ
ncbi:hypothetical protein DSUL_50431 [Desulfovibrionales bacterium]